MGGSHNLTSVSCASVSFCAAVDADGGVLIYNGTSWSARSMIDLSFNLSSVSCSSASFCSAVDNGGDAFTWNGAAWSTPSDIDGSQFIYSVSCSSAAFCVAVDGGRAITYHGAAWSTPSDIDGPNPLSSVSCPSASFCVAVDKYGGALTYDGTLWSSPSNIDSPHVPTSVSCPLASFCAAVDDGGNVLIDSAPTNRGTIGVAPILPPGTQTLGAVPPSQQMDLLVFLKPRNPTALDAEVQAVSTPSSPSYRHFLARGQFAHQFGASRAAIKQVRSILGSLNLKPGAIEGDGLAIPVRTTTAGAEAAFGVTLENYKLPGGRQAYANEQVPSLPSSVAGEVGAVLGLDDLTPMEPAGLVRDSSHSALTRFVPQALPTGGPQPCTPGPVPGSGTADMLASAYGFNNFYQHGDLGAGTTVALYEEGDFKLSDINNYQACYGTNTSVTVEKLSTFPFTPTINGNASEVTADIEDVIGLAPQAKIIVYEVATPFFNIPFPSPAVNLYVKIADDDAAKVVSSSYGSCFNDFWQDPTSPWIVGMHLAFVQMALQGQSMLNSAGDQGSEECGGSGLAVESPADDPALTSVGGTEWTNPLPGLTEATWNDSTGAGGGGMSGLWPKPAWQNGPGVISSANHRQLPDVSALASSASPGYAFFCTVGNCPSQGVNGWGTIGGTSLATPTWASLVALMDSALIATGHGPEGFLNPLLYSSPSLFNDITMGNNNIAGGTDFLATPGFDMATGLGTPKGLQFCGLVGLCQVFQLSPLDCCAPGTVTMPFSETLSATGAVAPYSWQLAPGSSPLPPGFNPLSMGGVISGIPTKAGNYSFTVQVQDSTSPTPQTTSQTFTLEVLPAPVHVAVTGSSSTWSPPLSPGTYPLVQLGDSVQLSAQLSPPPDNGSVQFALATTAGNINIGNAIPCSPCSTVMGSWTSSPVGDQEIIATFTPGDLNYKSGTGYLGVTVYQAGDPVIRVELGCSGGSLEGDWYGSLRPAVNDPIKFTLEPSGVSNTPLANTFTANDAQQVTSASWVHVPVAGVGLTLNVDDEALSPPVNPPSNPYTQQVTLPATIPCGVLQQKSRPPMVGDVLVNRTGPVPVFVDPLHSVDAFGEFNVDPLTLHIVARPKYGKIKVISGGSCDQCVGAPRELEYVSKSSAATDSFTYRVSNIVKQTSNTATVTIDFIPGKMPSVVVAPQARHRLHRKSRHTADG